jgi:hypothetical protein
MSRVETREHLKGESFRKIKELTGSETHARLFIKFHPKHLFTFMAFDAQLKFDVMIAITTALYSTSKKKAAKICFRFLD